MKRDKFFFIMGILFLVVVLGGFVPRFFLKPFLRDALLPVYFIVHGGLLLTWYVAYVYQAHLISKGKIINHRKYGMYWFILAILITLSNLYVLHEVSEDVLEGRESYYHVLRTVENTGMLIIGNLCVTLLSVLFLIISYLKRNKALIHKRAIFAASVIWLQPAWDRFMRPLGLEAIHPFLFVFTIYVLPVALIIYDIKTLKKPQAVSIWFLILFLLLLPIILYLKKLGMAEVLINLFG